MWQLIKRSLWVLMLASGLQSSWAYSLAGPIANAGDAWQAPIIGYGLGGDINAPKNIGEEYRRNTPVVYYTFDANFLDFFGSNGVVAVRNAFVILNALTNVDNYSPFLSEFPMESRHQNYQAQALGLLDLKSATLGLMVEQLGLSDPVRYAWTLHDRDGTPCPAGEQYLVVQRNFDFISDPLNQLQYSPYINNTLYSYQISEACTGGNPLALAVPFSVDPLADTFSPVASYTSSGTVFWGDYFMGLTRDDVAGLRYLFTTNNFNWETPEPGALLLTSTLGLPGPFVTTSNLSQLLVFAQTNDPSLIPGTFPNVVVASAVTNWVVVTNWAVTSTFISPLGAPAGTSLLQVSSNIVGTAFVPTFVDTFANVITNGNLTNFQGVINVNGTFQNVVFDCTNVILNYSPNTPATIQTVSLYRPNGAPAGTIFTNTFVQNIIISNQPSGEFITVPPGQCGWEFLCQSPTFNIIAITNLITTATNTTITNALGFVGSQSIVTYFTNHTFLVRPINCASTTPGPGLYEGIGKVQFVEADFDSLLGQTFQPVTNNYTMTLVTNSQAVVQKFQRLVTRPDFVFSASDQASSPSDPVIGVSFGLRSINFNQGNILPLLAGPGTINTPTTITFDKVGPVYFNSTASVLDGTPYFTETPGNDLSDVFFNVYFVWASFDGTTNVPVVYPNGTSIDNMQRQVLTQVSPSSLSAGFTDTPYGPVIFTAAGGAFTQPYTWSASGLPPGLNLVSNPDSTATLSGAPSQSGTFNFILTLTDYVGRSVQWAYPITIQ